MINSLLVTVAPPLAIELRQKLQQVARTVYFYPITHAEKPSESDLSSVDAIFCDVRGLPKYITNVATQCPKLKFVQFSCSSVSRLADSPAYQDKEQRQRVDVCNASGLHVITIPPYVVSTIHMIYLRLHEQFLNARNKAKWIDDLPDRRGGPYYGRTLRGRTVGLLGYGHLGRETARLLKQFGAHIIAANTRGTRQADKGYILPGTGDPEASIPSEMYSSGDDASLDAFLKRCDVLVSSLPSTPQTRGLLTAKRLALLPKDALYVNMGRGDVCASKDILEALDRPLDQGNGPLLGAIMDVTDPEPLPDGHPLFTHPNAIITPHLSGDAEGELETATDICYQNLRRLDEGKGLLNCVDMTKGY